MLLRYLILCIILLLFSIGCIGQENGEENKRTERFIYVEFSEGTNVTYVEYLLSKYNLTLKGGDIITNNSVQSCHFIVKYDNSLQTLEDLKKEDRIIYATFDDSNG